MRPTPGPVLTSPEDVDLPLDDGSFLKGWHWRLEEPSGILLISHGYGEHSGLYRSFAEYLTGTIGVDVLGLDFQGHGRSPGRRGALLRYEDLVDQLLAALRWAGAQRPGLPRFLLGHSNGGLVASLAMLAHPGDVSGLILSNPALRLKIKPPPLKIAAGRVLRGLAPWVTMNARVPVEDVTSDPLRQVELTQDRLVHRRISAPYFFGMIEGGTRVLDQAGALTMPLLLILSGADRIVDPDAGRAFFHRYGGTDKTLLEQAGMAHHALLERDRGLIYESIAQWVENRLGSTVDPAQGTETMQREDR